MRDPFFQSLMVSPPRIFGVKLMPFSLAHQYILQTLESPYVSGGECSVNDLCVALFICSRTWEENKENIFSGKLGQKLQWLRLRMLSREKIDNGHVSFLQYIKDYTCVPERKEPIDEDNDGFKFSVPWQFHKARKLMSYYGFSESMAWNCPVSRSCCYYDTACESDGDDTLLSINELYGESLLVQAREAERDGDFELSQKLNLKAEEFLKKK